MVRTLTFHVNNMGSSPIRDEPFIKQLTQLVEYFAYNEKVSGSIPLLFKKILIINKIQF